MKTLMTLTLLLMVNSFVLGQERALGSRNGSDWKQIRIDAEAKYSQVDWSNKNQWINSDEQTRKIYYVLGIFELSCSLPSSSYVKYEDEKGKEHFFDAGNPFPYTFGVTVGQMVDGMDALYQDYRNTNIRLLDAMHLVQMEVSGKSAADIEWQTRYYRADPEARRQMNEEKFKVGVK